MNLQKITKDLLKQYKIRPDKLKSQNFLIAGEVYDGILSAASINKNDIVLEIGPGLGFLTAKLLPAAKKVIAVEVDKSLIVVLEKLKSSYNNLELLNKNILGFDETSLPSGYKLVANLPYHLTGKIIKKFLTSQNKPLGITVLVQKEVAERICSQPGKHSLLSLSVQYYGQPKIVKVVPKNNFMPIPKVDSALLSIKKINKNISKNEERIFWQAVRVGFSSRRKTLVHNLAAGFKMNKKILKDKIRKIGLAEMVRAQELSIDEWKRLIEVL